MVRPVGADVANFSDVRGRDILDPRQRRHGPVEPARLQAEDGLVRPQESGKRVVAEDTSADSRDHEERRPAPGGLDRDQRASGCRTRAPADEGGEALDGGDLEQGGQREEDSEPVFQLGEQPHRQKRVPAEVEETVADAHRADRENVPPDLHQLPLELVARRDPDGGLAHVFGLGQRPAVDLAVRAQWKPIGDIDEGRRDHVFGERAPQELPELARVERAVADDVADESRVAVWGAAHRDHGGAHLRVPRQRGLDLAGLHAESADLDLVV